MPSSARPSVYSHVQALEREVVHVGRDRAATSGVETLNVHADSSASGSPTPPERRRARAAVFAPHERTAYGGPHRPRRSPMRASPRRPRSPTVVRYDRPPPRHRRLGEPVPRAARGVRRDQLRLRRHTLTQAEYDVLLTVTRGDDMTARLRDVTANMLISQPSVSRLVDRMAARGLIAKCADPDDGRGRAGARHRRGRRRVPPGRLAPTAGRSPSGCRCSTTTSSRSCAT